MALIGDYIQVLVGGYDLTGDSNKVDINDKKATYEVTAFGDVVHNFIAGKRTLSLKHSGFMNSMTAHSHPVLKGGNIQGSFSLLLGQNAAPAVGDPVYSLYFQQASYAALPEVNKFVPFSADFLNAGLLGGWGVALTPPVTFTNTTTGTAVNEGAQTTNGGAAFLHVLQAAASDTYTIIVEGSATGAFAGEQTTLATFTLNASAIGSERKAISGTVHQYLRFKATRTGSAGNTVKIAVSLVRF